MELNATELMGYLASALLMISFTLKNLRTLRIVNTLGCTSFVIYGFMLGNVLPIIITNGFIVAVNLYHLSRGPRL